MYKKIKKYSFLLKNFRGINTQVFNKDVKAILFIYTIVLDPIYFGISRDEIISQLAQKGIEIRRGYYTPSQLFPYKSNYKLINSEHLSHFFIILLFKFHFKKNYEKK